MSDPKLKISSAADIGRVEPEPFALPHLHNGKRLIFLLRQLNVADVSRASAGPPVMAPDAEGNRRLTSAEAIDTAMQLREIARAGIVEPKLSFDGEPGARWDDLSAGNQMAIVNAINRLAGTDQSPDTEAAKRAAGFPAEPGGTKGGAAPDPKVRAGAAAA
jgi:hypothetical protein